MFMGLGMPIPDLSNKPGPGRPGWGPAGTYDFQFEVSQGQVAIAVLPRVNGLRFTVKWQDGTEQAITSANLNLQSPTTDAGIISINNEKLDTTWCDDFKIVSGNNLVTKVISWGQNPWSKLEDAFKDCTNLTEISTTSLTTDTTGNLNNLFSGCTSLTDVSIKGWNLLSGCSIEGLFDGCTNIEKLDATGLVLKIKAASRFAFREVGSTVANGCEFLMSGLDFSTSTSMGLGDAYPRGMFHGVKIKPNSDFSNWNLTVSTTTTFNFAFADAKILGDNSTLNISNWTFGGNTNSTASNFFQNLETSDSTNRGLSVDITNWNFGNITSLAYFFSNCDLSSVTGLNTLTASNFTNIGGFFQYTKYLSISSTDNLSSSFRNAVNATGSGISYFAQNLGGELANESDWGVFPNMDGMNLSGVSSFTSVFTGGRYSTGINLGNVTFPTTALNYSSLFNSTRLSAGNGIDLTTTTLKGSNFQQMFQLTWTDFVKMGSGIDWSSVTTMYGFNYLINYLRPGGAIANSIELPTGLNISSLSNIGLWGIDANYSQCQIDNFIRSMWLYQRPPVPSTPTLNFSGGTGLTAAPMVVKSKVDDLITEGWSFNGEASPDITAPFAYPSYSFDSEVTQSVTPTTIPTGGQFSSTDTDITVNASTGVVSWDSTYMGLPIIRCTYTDGCYNEVQMSMLVTVDNNYSMKFDSASSSYINLGTTPNTGDISISFWVKYSTGSSTYVASGDGIFAYLRFNSTQSKLSFVYANVNYDLTTDIKDGNWHHVVVTYDQSASTVKGYTDGSLSETHINKSAGTTNNIKTIGAWNTGSTGYFNGAIDEFAVFNRVLTSAQVKLIYDANSANKSIKLTSLPGGAPVAWYRMGD